MQCLWKMSPPKLREEHHVNSLLSAVTKMMIASRKSSSQVLQHFVYILTSSSTTCDETLTEIVQVTKSQWPPGRRDVWQFWRLANMIRSQRLSTSALRSCWRQPTDHGVFFLGRWTTTNSLHTYLEICGTLCRFVQSTSRLRVRESLIKLVLVEELKELKTRCFQSVIGDCPQVKGTNLRLKDLKLSVLTFRSIVLFVCETRFDESLLADWRSLVWIRCELQIVFRQLWAPKKTRTLIMSSWRGNWRNMMRKCICVLMGNASQLHAGAVRGVGPSSVKIVLCGIQLYPDVETQLLHNLHRQFCLLLFCPHFCVCRPNLCEGQSWWTCIESRCCTVFCCNWSE